MVKGSARAAYMPSTRQNWGMARFALPPGAPDRETNRRYNPPLNIMVFVQPEGCPWTSLEVAHPFPCPNAQDLPAGVREAWRLKSPSEEACKDASQQQVSR